MAHKTTNDKRNKQSATSTAVPNRAMRRALAARNKAANDNTTCTTGALDQVLGNGVTRKTDARPRIPGRTGLAPVALPVGQPALLGAIPETLFTVTMGQKSVCFRTTPELTRLRCAMADRFLTEAFGEDGHLEIACGNIVEAFEDDQLQTPDVLEAVAQLGLLIAMQTQYGAAIARGVHRVCMLKIKPMNDATGRYEFGLYLAEHADCEGEPMQ